MKDTFLALRAYKQEKHLKWKKENTKKIKDSGLKFRSVNEGESLIFREEGKPKVDFYPSTGRWRVVSGKVYTYRGGAGAFIKWYSKAKP